MGLHKNPLCSALEGLLLKRAPLGPLPLGLRSLLLSLLPTTPPGFASVLTWRLPCVLSQQQPTLPIPASRHGSAEIRYGSAHVPQGMGLVDVSDLASDVIAPTIEFR